MLNSHHIKIYIKYFLQLIYMKILSFDVGIKNLAICLLETKNETDEVNENIKIIDWQLIDLSNTPKYFCSAKKYKNKKKTLENCNANANYKDPHGNYFCKRHGKATEFLIPETEINSNQLKRHPVRKLHEIIEKYSIKTEVKKKDQLINTIEEYKREKFLTKIETLRSGKDSLIDLCVTMTQKLNEVRDSNDSYKEIDVVLIENQIGRIAVRMKSIQGMLTQYFVHYGIPTIDYVSSMNKLKYFCSKKNMNYKERKAESIIVTRSHIQKYNQNWLEFFNTFSKKDDLADCFLQGLWYIKEHSTKNTSL